MATRYDLRVLRDGSIMQVKYRASTKADGNPKGEALRPGTEAG